MQTDPRPELVAQLQQARSEMIAHLDEIDKNRKIYPLWTIREILAHIAGWDDAIIASLRAHIAGREPGTPASRGIDAYNAESVTTREGLDYDHIYREYLHTRDTLIDLVNTMPLEKAFQPFIMPWGAEGNLESLLKIFIHHEIEHAGDLRKIMADAASA
jgi:uncharacterized damage-inducible protein DinB